MTDPWATPPEGGRGAPPADRGYGARTGGDPAAGYGGYEPPRRDGFVGRRMPRTLAAAAHVTAAATWTFVAGVLLMRLWLEGFDSAGGFVVWLMLFFVLGPIVASVVVGALLVAVAGLMITVPLAISWLRTPDREGSGGFALAHVTAAVLVGGYVLARILT